MAEPTLFDRILNKTLPSHKVAEDELWYSFLDIFVAEFYADNFFSRIFMNLTNHIVLTEEPPKEQKKELQVGCNYG